MKITKQKILKILKLMGVLILLAMISFGLFILFHFIAGKGQIIRMTDDKIAAETPKDFSQEELGQVCVDSVTGKSISLEQVFQEIDSDAYKSAICNEESKEHSRVYLDGEVSFVGASWVLKPAVYNGCGSVRVVSVADPAVSYNTRSLCGGFVPSAGWSDFWYFWKSLIR
jgi:hypothetical protein